MKTHQHRHCTVQNAQVWNFDSQSHKLAYQFPFDSERKHTTRSLFSTCFCYLKIFRNT